MENLRFGKGTQGGLGRAFASEKAPKVAYRVLWVREGTPGGLWSAFGSGGTLGGP
jgi:hypothetical protein